MPRAAGALFLALLLCGGDARAARDGLTVACATNFTATLRQLAGPFRERHGATLRVVSGATGQLYAQIVNGAPYDVFLAADGDRPTRLIEAGRAIAGSRRTYALGRLVLWRPDAGRISGPAALQDDFRRLAIADPRLAPYGLAARQTLQALDLWETVRGRLALGQNIAQAYQFTASGNAGLGFIARAQWVRGGHQGTGWPVPAELHEPIRQQAVTLRDSESARAFMDYLGSDTARQLIAAAGYDLADGERTDESQ